MGRDQRIWFTSAVVGALLVFILIAPAAAGETMFPGGSLADLQALSPTLTFDALTISGTLSLPAGGSATLKVNQLTITASGGVGYTYSSCTYLPAPDFTVQATGKVVVNGDIHLVGRSGTRTLSSSTCNQCGGEPGGNVRITADEVTVSSEIRNYGGSGSTSVSDGSCSFGCAGGDAGGIYLSARNITLSEATLQTYGAKGGTGYCYGDENHGADGDPGPVQLSASSLFKMSQSTVATDGVVTLTAATTDIYGPITGSQLNATIDGNPDAQGPQVKILAPLPDSVVTVGQPLEVRIQVKDLGAGVKEIQVDGLGYSQLHSAEEMVNGVLTFTIAKPLPPATLTVIARDNQGNAKSASVSGLSLAGNLSIPQGETLNLIGDLLFEPESAITVAGTLVIKRGADHRITAGSLRITATGIVKDEDLGPEDDYSKAPSLNLTLRGPATVDGIIDVSGNSGWDYYTEHGGDITLRAARISVTGSLMANGGYASKSEGGNGGTITLISSLSLNIQGTLSAKGASGGSGWNCCRGGNGGKIILGYLTVANTTGGIFDVSAGTGWSGTGTAGSVAASYLGRPNPSSIQAVSESEPNNSEARAQWLLPPVRVSASVTPADAGSLQLGGDDFEDMYLLRLQTPLAVTVELDPAAADIDMDLLMVKFGTLETVASSLSGQLGVTERIAAVDLEPGSYLILVSQFGETPAAGSAYTLTVRPAAGADSDGDGLSDWWEKTHFGSLDRNGSLDADNDGLSDRGEHDRGTHPLVADTDGDGMPDSWEVAHRLDPLANDAAADPDKVGKTNLEEYRDGTDPNPRKATPWLPLLLE